MGEKRCGRQQRTMGLASEEALNMDEREFISTWNSGKKENPSACDGKWGYHSFEAKKIIKNGGGGDS